MLVLRYSKRRVRSVLTLLALLFTATLEPRATQIQPSGNEAVKAIRFRKLITMNGPAIDDAVVVVEGERIRAIGHEVPPNALVTDLRRYTGIPGLIDVHVHLSYAVERRPGADPFAERPTAVSVFLAQDNARRTLESGVTTVRSMTRPDGADYLIRQLIEMGAMQGPRIVVGGQMSRAWRNSDPDAATLLALQRIAAGADLIKMFGSTGSGANVTGTQTFTYEEMAAVVDVAHRLGKRVAVHSYGPEAARDAVRAGADSIEHAVDLDEATLAEMARRQVVYVPTVDHNRYYAEHAGEFRYTDQDVRNLNAFIVRNLETLRRAINTRVPITMGSDAVFTMFGENSRELRWFVQAGMTTEQALATATTNAAALLGLEGKVGVLTPGAFADLVAIEGDPLASIDNVINGVRWVMKGGAVVVERGVGR